MKKQLLFSTVILILAVFAMPVFAQSEMGIQRSNSIKSSSDESEVCSVKVRALPTGCEVVFTNQPATKRDAASGMASGKRQHKPIRITKELDKSTPLLIQASPGSGGGKVVIRDLRCVITSNGRNIKVPVMNNQFSIPSDGIDDDCNMVLSWTWVFSDGTKEECVFPLKLSMENGACVRATESKTTMR